MHPKPTRHNVRENESTHLCTFWSARGGSPFKLSGLDCGSMACPFHGPENLLSYFTNLEAFMTGKGLLLSVRKRESTSRIEDHYVDI